MSQLFSQLTLSWRSTDPEAWRLTMNRFPESFKTIVVQCESPSYVRPEPGPVHPED